MRLNGKQTIYQMIQLADRVRERGGEPRDRSGTSTNTSAGSTCGSTDRVEGLPEWLHPARRPPRPRGARPAGNLRRAACRSTWPAAPTSPSSSTRPSCSDLTRYFGQHIYGAQDDYKTFSKKMVIERILRENDIPGEQLLSFGDGYVEIENTKEVGGLAVAVASDEANNGSGRMDEWKRSRLLGVGADVVIPDFRDGDALLEMILGK